MSGMNVQIVRDGLVQCDASVAWDATVQRGFLSLVADEERLGMRWLGTYMVFSSRPYEQERFSDIVQGHAMKAMKTMKKDGKPPMKAMKTMKKDGKPMKATKKDGKPMKAMTVRDPQGCMQSPCC